MSFFFIGYLGFVSVSQFLPRGFYATSHTIVDRGRNSILLSFLRLWVRTVVSAKDQPAEVFYTGTLTMLPVPTWSLLCFPVSTPGKYSTITSVRSAVTGDAHTAGRAYVVAAERRERPLACHH
ncbi:hypothetical protein AcW1_009453 [Taiwanofungus camphoratus]|nr:hypothetical protein AcV7_006956 [Antrodia cinnamomea]KAI0947779.1 hypothetical protein AcW1_009453 [Antrodia cinnamomea]